MEPSFEEELYRLIDRSRPGYRAFCASVDLLGISDMLSGRLHEASSRLNDLQQGFGDAVLFFRGGGDYRACFVGDSWFLIRELKPEDDEGQLWPYFCGHIYALAQFIQDMELSIGNPGLRVIISRGTLAQLATPDNWQDPQLADLTRNWFVLTGASEALSKCQAVERAGSRGGFPGGYFWHESPEKELRYWGTPFFKLPPDWYTERQYPLVYQLVCERHDKDVVLTPKYLAK